ncbi:hypothetical protein [Variovorax sp. GB4R4]|uniref:hypothetical protein n=2 Tax=unclassified Variovorax TaxID=663243 RepID=UPI003F459D03
MKNVAAATPVHPVGGMHRRWAVVCWAAVIAAVMFSMPMLPYLQEPADLWNHIQYAKSIHQWSDVVSPHFLFQLLVIAIAKASSLSYEAAAIVLMSLCYAGMAGMIGAQIRRSSPRGSPMGALSVAVLVLLVSHIFVQTALALNFYYGYIAPTVYHNPTQVLSKALSIAVLFAYFRVAFEGQKGAVWMVILPVGVILSAVAKPSFLIAFLPCVCAVEFYRALSGSWKAALRNLTLVAIPACIVLALQYRVTFNGSPGGGGLGFAPFAVYGGPADVLKKLPGSLLFPVVAAVVIWRQRAKANRLLFAWFLYAVGMTISICVVESGGRMMQGNFAWTGQTVTFLLYVESAIAVAAVAWRRAWPAWAAFGLHVIFGAIWYSAALLMPIGTFL